MKYFTDAEIRSPDTLDYRLARGFGDRLDSLREAYGPISINSGARSKEHNKAIGGHTRSLHVYDDPYHNTEGCCAVDVSVTNGVDRHRLVTLALSMGFSVGVNRSFIHIDDRTKVLGLAPMVFTY